MERLFVCNLFKRVNVARTNVVLAVAEEKVGGIAYDGGAFPCRIVEIRRHPVVNFRFRDLCRAVCDKESCLAVDIFPEYIECEFYAASAVKCLNCNDVFATLKHFRDVERLRLEQCRLAVCFAVHANDCLVVPKDADSCLLCGRLHFKRLSEDAVFSLAGASVWICVPNLIALPDAFVNARLLVK